MPDGTLVRPSASSFRAARDEYLLTLAVENKSPHTLAIYGYAIDRLHRFTGDVAPAALDTALLRWFLRQLQQEGLAATNQHDYLRAIKIWLRWLADEGGYGVAADDGARQRVQRRGDGRYGREHSRAPLPAATRSPHADEPNGDTPASGRP